MACTWMPNVCKPPDKTAFFFFYKAFVCSGCTEWSECWSPACLFTSAPSQVNKHRTWPCCWETRRVCTIYKRNGPDDALMAARMEALAALLAAASGKMTRTAHDGRVTRSMTGRKCVMGDADLKESGSHWTPSERSFMLQARSVFRLLYISSAVTTHFEINSATSLFNKKPHRTHSTHFPARVFAPRNVFVRKKPRTQITRHF